MFLWARLVLEYLFNNIFYTRQEIYNVVDSLPRKLSELLVSVPFYHPYQLSLTHKEATRECLTNFSRGLTPNRWRG